ncbi:hypothetical protein [Paraburkholderia sp. DGU8]
MFNVEDAPDAVSILLMCCARSAWLLSLALDSAAEYFSVGIDA